MRMDKEDTLSIEANGTAAELRRRAEERLNALETEARRPRTEDESQRLLHELQVHQIELEMQNAELRLARNEAERAVEMYSDLYDFAPVGYVTLDRKGIIRTANLTVATLLKTERSRLVGRRFGLFVDANTRATLMAFLDKVFAGQAREACEVALLNEGKGLLFVQIEAAATASGQECRAVIIDISVRRQLDEKLEILHADLAAHAAELESANIELEAFNYSVSHDLRRPLTVINGYCQVVQELFGNKLDAQCKGYIEEIYEGTLSMKRLIDSLLEFSCAARVEMSREAVDLSAMAKAVAEELKMEEPQWRVIFRIGAGIMADGDADLLRVVLDNLIGNAWKYAGSREGAVIDIDVTEVDGKAVFFVRDNGPGFDMALADKLFLPFQRLPGTDVEGHGVGLATVERIVRRHGGRVWAESTPGQGATFFFTFDASRRDETRRLSS
ncbi:MAG: sensor histidine kinase [Trichloromonadaceae bacterium]